MGPKKMSAKDSGEKQKRMMSMEVNQEIIENFVFQLFPLSFSFLCRKCCSLIKALISIIEMCLMQNVYSERLFYFEHILQSLGDWGVHYLLYTIFTLYGPFWNASTV